MTTRFRGAGAPVFLAGAMALGAACSDSKATETPLDGGVSEDGASPSDAQGHSDDDAQVDGATPEDGSSHPEDAAVGGHDFGSHGFPYASGSILPSDPQAARDAATAQFYDAWKAKYLIKDCGPGRYYVATTLDGSGGGQGSTSITVSEGNGYGMVITALMKGHDPEARALFDGIYLFFRDHPSVHSADLMAWNQVKGCGNDPDGGDDSATDGDLDVAFGLLLASRQWSGGSIDYAAEARKVISAVLAHDINASTKLTTLGDWSDSAEAHYFGTRPSDFMLDHFRAFGKVTGDATWTGVVDAHYGLVAKVQTALSPKTGLLPDFVIDTNTTPQPAPANFLEGNDDGSYAWNSCRFPWHLGTDYLVSGDARAKPALATINAWIRGAANQDPGKIVAGYHLDGTTLGSTDNSLAFVAPFGVSAMSDASNQAWLDAIWKLVIGRALSADNYYGNSIKLLTMIVMSGNWWEP